MLRHETKNREDGLKEKEKKQDSWNELEEK